MKLGSWLERRLNGWLERRGWFETPFHSSTLHSNLLGKPRPRRESEREKVEATGPCTRKKYWFPKRIFPGLPLHLYGYGEKAIFLFAMGLFLGGNTVRNRDGGQNVSRVSRRESERAGDGSFS